MIMPNGARILDQLGIYDEMSCIMTRMRRTFTRRSDGRLVSGNKWPSLVRKKLGYSAEICERKVFLRSMFNQLKDKSRVCLGKKVVAMEHLDGGIRVVCEDGGMFTGDLVIGADGIHSKTRKEMQKFAEETGSEGLINKDKNSK